jgi:hypothetical protein
VPPPSFSEIAGKEKAIRAAMNQCVKLPSAWPPALTSLGNTSEINTQMTAPCEKAKKAIYINSKTGTAMPPKDSV